MLSIKALCKEPTKEYKETLETYVKFFKKLWRFQRNLIIESQKSPIRNLRNLKEPLSIYKKEPLKSHKQPKRTLKKSKRHSFEIDLLRSFKAKPFVDLLWLLQQLKISHTVQIRVLNRKSNMAQHCRIWCYENYFSILVFLGSMHNLWCIWIN